MITSTYESHVLYYSGSKNYQLLKIIVTRFSNSLVGYLFSEHPLKQHKKFKR